LGSYLLLSNLCPQKQNPPVKPTKVPKIQDIEKPVEAPIPMPYTGDN
jgi:hypothetical protein